jgi:hypothetical protein
MPMAVQGACLCGTVRYESDGPFHMMIHCHCSMCRKHHGSAFATFVGAALDGFRWLGGEDNIESYRSSERGQRSFCRTCSSVTPILATEMGMALLPAGNLLDDPGVRPQAHVFVGSKAPWYEITDQLPQHAEYPPEFGASGIECEVHDVRAGTLGGSCLCGDVRYEVTGPIVRTANCHCSRCRRARSAAHATNFFCRLDDFRFTSGEQRVRYYKVPEAQYFTVAFCDHCGSAVPRASADRGIAVIPAGSLDGDPEMRPQIHIFTGSKAPWFEITDALPQHAEMP